MFFDRQYGLRFKLTAILISATAIWVVCVGYFAARESLEALRQQKQQDELVMARNIAADVDEALLTARHAVEILAKEPSFLGSDSSRRRAVTLVARVTDLIDGLIILDPRGGIVALDESGPDVARVVPPSPYEQIVGLVRRAGASAYSSVYKSRTGDLAVAIGTPIRLGDRWLGVLAGGMLLDKHSLGGIEGIRIGKRGYAYIVDSRGEVIVKPKEETIPERDQIRSFVRGRFGGHDSVVEFRNLKGSGVLAAYAPIRETDWGVVVQQPTSESYALANRLSYLFTLALVLGLLGSAVLGALLAWRISGPVTALAEGVQIVSTGRLDVRIPVETRDEIGGLARAFNGMTAKLKQHVEDLMRARAQLAQSEKLAAIGQLAAGLAHEINNPLNIVSGFAEYLLGKARPSDPDREHLEDILRETRRCQRLVQELLRFAKPKEPRKSETDLNALVEETLSLLRSRADFSAIRLEKSLKPGLPFVNMDRDQIQQVLLNIFINACQAMDRGGILTVETRRERGRVAVATLDTGGGIAPEHRERIFEPFFTTKDAGSGLGLSLSHSMVELHGGTIEVRSEPGRGTAFTVLLPVGGDRDEKWN